MSVFERMSKHGHEQLVFCHDKTSGLRAIIAIHDTTLGPALGGTRYWNYATEEEAIEDALRLSEGMTFKSAAAGCNFGGGKAVIWGDPSTQKTEGLLRAFGIYVESLGGRFITGTDVGTVAEDFAVSFAETEHLVALPEAFGGSGDSSVITAFGVLRGIKATAKELFGMDSLQGRKVAVQGVGKVGRNLVRYLKEEGAQIVIADIDPAKVQAVAAEFGAQAVSTDAIVSQACDILSPNALGRVFDDQTIGQLRCKGIAGGANNQLAEERHGDELRRRGILYAPDYVVNAGGLIQVADELRGFNRERAFKTASAIYDLLLVIFRIARERGVSTNEAANVMVRERLAAIGGVKRIFVAEEPAL
jgi:leucine dehydrogenase